MSVTANNIGNIFNIFINLTKELEPFVKTDDLKIAFTKDGKVYLVGDDFTDIVDADFGALQDFRNSLRIVIARHRSQYKPEQ
jgi:hypothetical protein